MCWVGSSEMELCEAYYDDINEVDVKKDTIGGVGPDL